MVNVRNKGQIFVDLYFILFVILLAFLVFFSLAPTGLNKHNEIIAKLIITENAISKVNPAGIGFADNNKNTTKTVLQNTLKEPKIIEPIKKIKIIDINNQVLFEEGKITCEKQTNIERLIIYDKNIAKVIFYFC